MDWLKEILGKSTVTEEGKLDVEAIMAAVGKAFPLHAVPKKEFNDKAAELKAANDTIAALKKDYQDVEKLQKKVGEYEIEVKNLRKAAEDNAKEYSLKEQLTKAGVVDPDYLIYKAGGTEKFTFDKNNHPIGVEETLRPFKEDEAMAHLFKQEPQRPPYSPQNGGAGGTANPFAKETYNMTEQARLLKSNPEQARALASAAGVSI